MDIGKRADFAEAARINLIVCLCGTVDQPASAFNCAVVGLPHCIPKVPSIFACRNSVGDANAHVSMKFDDYCVSGTSNNTCKLLQFERMM